MQTRQPVRPVRGRAAPPDRAPHLAGAEATLWRLADSIQWLMTYREVIASGGYSLAAVDRAERELFQRIAEIDRRIEQAATVDRALARAGELAADSAPTPQEQA